MIIRKYIILISDTSIPDLLCIFDVCDIFCEIMCILHDCECSPICSFDSQCLCNEVYHFQTEDLTVDRFKTLPFEKMWNYYFGTSPISVRVKNKITNNPQLKKFALQLLQNPRITPEEMKMILSEQYPNINELKLLKSIPHGTKELITHGNNLDSSTLKQYFKEYLIKELKKKPRNFSYRKKFKKLLDSIDSEEELLDIKNQIRMSGNKPLLHFFNSYLRKRNTDLDMNTNDVCTGRKCRGRKRLRRQSRRRRGKFHQNPEFIPKVYDTIENEDNIIKNIVIDSLADDTFNEDDDQDYDMNPSMVPPALKTNFKKQQSDDQFNYSSDFPNIRKRNDFLSGKQKAGSYLQENVMKASDRPNMPPLQSNKQRIPDSLLENFPTVSKTSNMPPGNLRKSFPTINNNGNFIKNNIEEQINRQKKRAEEMAEQAASEDDNGKTHTTSVYNEVSTSTVSNDVNGKKTQFVESTVKNKSKDSAKPEKTIDESVKMNAVLVKDDVKKIGGKVIQTVLNDNVKGTSEIKSGSNGYNIIEGTETIKPNTKSTKINGSGLKQVYYMVEDENNNENVSEVENPENGVYVMMDNDGNIVKVIPQFDGVSIHNNIESYQIDEASNNNN